MKGMYVFITDIQELINYNTSGSLHGLLSPPECKRVMIAFTRNYFLIHVDCLLNFKVFISHIRSKETGH